MKQTRPLARSPQSVFSSRLFLTACLFYTVAFLCRFGVSLWSDWSQNPLFSLLFDSKTEYTLSFVSLDASVLSHLNLWLSSLVPTSFWWVYAAARKPKPYYSDGGAVLLRELARLQLFRLGTALLCFLLALSALLAFSVATQSNWWQNAAAVLIQLFSFSYLQSFSVDGLQVLLSLSLLAALGIWLIHMVGSVALFRIARSVLQSIRLNHPLSISFFGAFYCMVHPLLTLSPWQAPSLSVEGILGLTQHLAALLAAALTGVVLFRLRRSSLAESAPAPTEAKPLSPTPFLRQEQPAVSTTPPQEEQCPSLATHEQRQPSPSACPRCGSLPDRGQHYCFTCGRKLQ